MPETAAVLEGLDAQAARLVAEMAVQPPLPYPDVTPEQVRQHYRGLARWAAPPLPVDEVLDWTGAPEHCPVRLYRTERHAWSNRRPLVAYLHSGGWVVGGIAASDERCRRLAVATGAVVASIGYRLAPEHPHPVPLDDCWAAVRALTAHAPALGADPGHVVVLGDSAGGTLAAALALRARDTGEVGITGQVLLYPVTAADRSNYASARTYTAGYPLSLAELDWFVACHLGGAPHDASTAPLTVPDLRDLPPALVVTAGCDILRDEGEAYASRLARAAVPVQVCRIEGTVHGFFAQSGALDAAHEVTALVARWLRTHLGTGDDEGTTT